MGEYDSLRTEQAPSRERATTPTAWVAWFVRSPDPAWAGKRVHLDRGERLFGRQPSGAGTKCPVDDRRMSRTHGALTRFEAEKLLVRDLGSTNGTFVNGARVEHHWAEPGDVVRFGESLAVVDRVPVALLDAKGTDAELGIVGRSPAILALRDQIRRVAPSDLTVLVVGDSGTGKELVAAALHMCSGASGPQVPINCAAIPDTLVESALFGHRRGAFTGATGHEKGAFLHASGGTLFLDEVGELAPGAQPKLLRALENHEITPVGATMPTRVHTRVVAATNRDLRGDMERGDFRPDLYARLSGVVLTTPGLAERRQDILMLFDHFLPDQYRSKPMTGDFAEWLLCWPWPLNVRELKQLARRLPVLHGDVEQWDIETLPEEMRPDAPAAGDAATEEVAVPTNREERVALLERCGWSATTVATLVHRSRRQVYRWMKQFDVDPPRKATETDE